MAAVIVAAVFGAWANSLQAPFELDDVQTVTTNESIRHLWSLDWLHPPATGGETVSGRPVLNLSFAVSHALSGTAPWGYHLLNVAIHALAALLLFGLVRRTIDRPRFSSSDARTAVLAAGALALMWALHPLQTAAVTYVSQRAESLCGLFYLLTLYAFVRGAGAGGRAATGWFALSAGACLLGAGTKEVAVTAPLVVLLYDRAFIAGTFRVALRARGRAYLALCASWLVLAGLLVANPGRGGSAGFGGDVGPWQYLLTQCSAIVLYLRLAAWPSGLVFDYGRPLVHDPVSVLPQAILLVALAGATIWGLVRNHVAGFLGAAFFLILAPSSSVVPVVTQTVAEHRMYLALAPLVCLVGLAVQRLWRGRLPRWVLMGAAACIAVALGAATVARNHVYLSTLSLWRDTVAKAPDNARAHHNYGTALMAAGESQAAMAEFTRAIELQPNHAFAHLALAEALMQQGKPGDALAHLRTAVAVAPHLVDAQVNLGHVLELTGHPGEAAAHYRAALADDPGAQDARTNLAGILIRQGQAAEAVPMLRQALAASPQVAQSHYLLGIALEKSGGTPTEARHEFQTAVRLDPAFAPARLALGNRLAADGDLQGAEAALREAIRLDDSLADAHFALGNLLAQRRDFAGAIGEFNRVLALDPSRIDARANLGNCQLVTGRVQAAIDTYEAVLRQDPGQESVRQNLQVAREALAHPR